MSEKDIRRNAAILDKLKNYPEIITKYYQSLLESGKSLGTARTYMTSIFQFLDYSYGNHIPADFFYSTSENDIAFFLNSLKAKGNPNVSASGSAKAAVWSALMSLFSFISTKYPQVNNPVENIPRPAMTKKSASDLVYLTPVETKKLLQTVEQIGSFRFVNRDKSIFLLGLYCGLRINEILDLNVEDVNIDNGMLRIFDQKKGGRWINIGETVKKELGEWLVMREHSFPDIDTDAIFISQVNKRLSIDMVEKMLNTYAKDINKHVTTRVLRATFAVNLYKKTKDVLLLARYLDHASIATTQKYIAQIEEDEFDPFVDAERLLIDREIDPTKSREGKVQIKGYALQNETILEVGKFAILWNWFERTWCDNNCNPTKIKHMAKIIPVNTEKQAHLAEVLNKRRHWFRQLEMDYVRDSLHPGNARNSSEEDMLVMRQFLEQTGEELTRGCLLVLHRIRNNLMHGMKLLEELDGQIELFRAATAVLESMGER